MVRIPGDEAFILATIEVVNVILIALTVSILATLDNVWCMYMLRKHGEVVMYKNDIGHFASKAFRTVWNSLISVGAKSYIAEREKIAEQQFREEMKGPSNDKIRQFNMYRSVRTLLLFAGILLSVAELIVLFALSTEGKDVEDKAEFDVRLKEAVEVRSGKTMTKFYSHKSQTQYEYVFRRLGRRIGFKDGNKFEVQVPRRLDVLRNEKWPYTVRLEEEDVYATVYTRDFISQEKAQFNKTDGRVTGLTESGKRLGHCFLADEEKIPKPCSRGVGAGIVDVNSSSGIFCYTDELQDMSCADKEDGEMVSFSMKCSEVRVERFGKHEFTDPIWWLTEYASEKEGDGSEGIKQVVSMRSHRRDDISPSAVMIAALLTEYPSQSLVVKRNFAVDVGVVVVPNWLLITVVILVAVLLLLGALASAYAASRNLVNLTNWQEMYIANLLDPLDCLNRSRKTEFRCVVSQGWNIRQKYQLFVEPTDIIDPVPWVTRKEIGTAAGSLRSGK